MQGSRGAAREQRSSASLHCSAPAHHKLLGHYCYFLLVKSSTAREWSWQPLVPRIKSGLKTHFLYFAKTCKNKLPKINCRPIWRFPQITAANVSHQRSNCSTQLLVSRCHEESLESSARKNLTVVQIESGSGLLCR